MCFSNENTSKAAIASRNFSQMSFKDTASLTILRLNAYMSSLTSGLS